MKPTYMMKMVMAVVLTALLISCISGGCNRTLVDTACKFDYAYVQLPNGTIVEGRVQSWMDFTDNDQIRVTIDGKTYLTSVINVVLVKN